MLRTVSDFEENVESFSAKDESFSNQLVGEIDRLLTYHKKGWCNKVDIPEYVIQAYKKVRAELQHCV